MAESKEVLAQNILDLVGGKDNVVELTHCVTRLRFVLSDKSSIHEEEIKKLNGVMGAQWSGDQFQVIIGPTVSKVFDAVNKELGIIKEGNKTENEEKLTVKNFFGKLIRNLTACIYPALSIFVAAGLVNMIAMVCGPFMLGLMSAESSTYQVLTFAGNAGFYFLPIFLGYTSAKHLKVNPLMGMLMGAILIHPTLTGAAAAGGSFEFFGLPIKAVDYSTSVMPIILSVWVMSYVERFLKKYVPEALELLLVPFGTIFIMLPITLCLLAPLGNILGTYISAFLFMLKDVLGPIGTGVMSALYLPLIMTGMHHTVNAMAITNFLTLGYDEFVFVSVAPMFIAVVTLTVVFFLKSKKAANKSLGASGFFLQFVVGICEPALYGIILPTKSFFPALLIGGFAGGVYLGIMNVKVHAFLGSNFFCLLHYLGGTSGNFMHAMIGCVISFVVTFAIAWIGYKEQ